MKARCVAAVSSAIGRPITVMETRNIEQRIRDAMSRESSKDPQAWQGMSIGDRLKAGAEVAAKEIIDEANLKKTRIGLQISAHDRVAGYLDEQVAKGYDDDKLGGIRRLLAPKNDGKNNVLSVESNQLGIEATLLSRMVDTWEAISPRIMGLFANKEAEEAFIRQVHGTDVGDPTIKRAADAWLDTVETARQRFNSGGGNIGKLENWGMPHAWSQKIAIEVGRDQFAADMLPLLDRNKYRHENGNMYTDPELQAFLGEAWLSIATNGANKLKPDPLPGGAVKANRGAEHREIHFKDGDAALVAYQKFSERNLFQTLAGHVKRMSGDIALVEQFGPNADHMFESMVNDAYREASVNNPAGEGKAAARVAEVVNLYNYLAGNHPGPVHQWLANAMQDVRNLLSAAKLGSAAITSIADEGTLYLTSHVNRIPGMQVFMGELRGFNLADQTEKNLARRAGLMTRSMHEDIARFGSDSMGPRWSSKMSNAFMKFSGLNTVTELRRRAFGGAMMDTIGSLTRQFDSVSRLDPDDYRFLVSKGITQGEWDIWRQAVPEDWGHNDTVLTPDSIMRVPDVPQMDRERAATKLLSVILEEQNNAVIEPGAWERAAMTADSRAGTFKGELLRSIFLFKSFPHAMITKHFQRGIGAYDGWPGRAGYLGSLIALQTVMGAVAMETNDVLSGRDPRNLNPTEKHGIRNLIAALLKGGALGLYGDFLFDESGASGRSPVETMAGPVAGTMAAAIALTQGNAIQYMRGQETHAGAELARFLKGITPGSNLWYTKAALDHLIFQNMQEFFSPGYLADARAKAQRNAGTTYWWNPGQSIDSSRAPNMAGIVGAAP